MKTHDNTRPLDGDAPKLHMQTRRKVRGYDIYVSKYIVLVILLSNWLKRLVNMTIVKIAILANF